MVAFPSPPAWKRVKPTRTDFYGSHPRTFLAGLCSGALPAYLDVPFAGIVPPSFAAAARFTVPVIFPLAAVISISADADPVPISTDTVTTWTPFVTLTLVYCP